MMDTSGSGSSNPLAEQQSPDGQGNPLARLAPPLGGQPQQIPVPSRAQTVAAVKRLSAVQEAMRQVMNAKGYGKTNVRPELMDAASKLIGSRLLSLPEVMNSISGFPEDPIQQKGFIMGIFNSARNSEASILDAHGSAIAAGKLPPDGGPDYSIDDHDEHFQGMLSHYRR